MKLQIETSDGGIIFSKTYSLALSLWHFKFMPKPHRDESGFWVGAAQPGPYHPEFFQRVEWQIERDFGKTPKIPKKFIDKKWYNNLEYEYVDFRTVESNADNKYIQQYEQACRKVLLWLKKNADISRILVSK